MQTDSHVSSGIQTHDPKVRAGKDSSFLRLRGHCDWHSHTHILLLKYVGVLRTTAIWYMTLCILLEVHLCVEGTYCLHLQV
jgi:hypothetical protein